MVSNFLEVLSGVYAGIILFFGGARAGWEETRAESMVLSCSFLCPSTY